MGASPALLPRSALELPGHLRLSPEPPRERKPPSPELPGPRQVPPVRGRAHHLPGAWPAEQDPWSLCHPEAAGRAETADPGLRGRCHGHREGTGLAACLPKASFPSAPRMSVAAEARPPPARDVPAIPRRPAGTAPPLLPPHPAPAQHLVLPWFPTPPPPHRPSTPSDPLTNTEAGQHEDVLPAQQLSVGEVTAGAQSGSEEGLLPRAVPRAGHRPPSPRSRRWPPPAGRPPGRGAPGARR